MVEKTKKLYAFLDTNVLIHFPFINEIDWPKVLTSKQVCLVIAPIVLTELDNVKDGMTKPGRRELAGKVSKFITTSLEKVDPGLETPLPQRPDTTVMYFGEDDLAIKPQLRKDKQDDHLIAAMLHFKEKYPSFSTVLIAGDNNCRFRARGFGLDARNPEDLGLEKRPLPVTEEEKRLKQLERIIPKVKLAFGQKDGMLLLRHSDAINLVEGLKNDFKQDFINVIENLKRSYENNLRSFGLPNKAALTSYSQEKHGIHAPGLAVAKDFDLEIFEEWLSLEMSPVVFLGPSWEEERDPRMINRRQWKRVIEQFDAHFQKWMRVKEKFPKMLEYHKFALELEHKEGQGIQDAKLVIKTQHPIELLLPDSIPETVKTSQRVYPDSRVGSHQVTTLYFGNIHPSESKLYSLELHIFDPQKLYVSGNEPELSVTLSGLNIEPIEEKVKVKLV